MRYRDYYRKKQWITQSGLNVKFSSEFSKKETHVHWLQHLINISITLSPYLNTSFPKQMKKALRRILSVIARSFFGNFLEKWCTRDFMDLFLISFLHQDRTTTGEILFFKWHILFFFMSVSKYFYLHRSPNVHQRFFLSLGTPKSISAISLDFLQECTIIVFNCYSCSKNDWNNT